MKSCKNCIHFNACEDWAHNWGIEGLEFPWECSDDDNLCDSYNPQTLPPAYIGMKVWVPYVWMFKEIMTDLREGHVSGLQQKADKSWKFRITAGHSVADYSLKEVGNHIFFTEAEAIEEHDRRVRELNV